MRDSSTTRSSGWAKGSGVTEQTFTPAAGRYIPTAFYDAVAVVTRERLWRHLVVSYLAPRDDDVIVDVGCGTGSLALMVVQAQPAAQVVALDPDRTLLTTAQRKATAGGGGTTIRWQVGFGDATEQIVGSGGVTAAVSTLVLHQCPTPRKRAILSSMRAALCPGGRLVIADYGRQRTRSMRAAFRVVQLADGFGDTQPNADGILPELIADAGFDEVREVQVVPTVTGSISIYMARRS